MLRCSGGGEGEGEGIDGKFLTAIFVPGLGLLGPGEPESQRFICLRTYVYIDIANEKEFH